jgi:hypothetical protein
MLANLRTTGTTPLAQYPPLTSVDTASRIKLGRDAAANRRSSVPLAIARSHTSSKRGSNLGKCSFLGLTDGYTAETEKASLL